MAVARTGEFISAAAAWVVGGIVGAICCLVAFVLVPEVGLFGDANSVLERTVGVLTGLACGLGFVAGPLVIGARTRDLGTLVPAGLVAIAISAGVLAAAW
jgi:hypothetical protein